MPSLRRLYIGFHECFYLFPDRAEYFATTPKERYLAYEEQILGPIDLVVSSGLADGLKEMEIGVPKSAFHALFRMALEQGIPAEVPGPRRPVQEDPAVRDLVARGPWERVWRAPFIGRRNMGGEGIGWGKRSAIFREGGTKMLAIVTGSKNIATMGHVRIHVEMSGNMQVNMLDAYLSPQIKGCRSARSESRPSKVKCASIPDSTPYTPSTTTSIDSAFTASPTKAGIPSTCQAFYLAAAVRTCISSFPVLSRKLHHVQVGVKS